MKKSQKKLLYVGFGLAISALFIWLLFRGVDFEELVLALKGANYYWLIPNIILIVLTMYLRAFRWKLMIDPIKPVAYHKVLAATCVGFMANNVLPLRMGEFVRAYSLAKQDDKITKSASLATIVVERTFFDLAALLIILGGIFLVSDFIDEDLSRAITISIMIAIIALISVLIMGRSPEKSGQFLSKIFFFLSDSSKEFIKKVLVKFSEGLQFMSNIKAVFSIGFYTMLIWIVMAISNIFIFYAFNFDIPPVAGFLLLVIVSLAILLPSSPGFIGVYHIAAAKCVEIYGVSSEAALSFALVLHATQYLVVTLMGFYFLRKEHFSLKNLEEEASSEL